MTSSPGAEASREVVISAAGGLGHIRLNRPEKINALTTAMVGRIDAALAEWEHDPAIAAVWIDGAGERGLCAGGDVAALHDGIVSGTPLPRRFWAAEYAMNARIGAYPKPVVAVLDGITFGGGIGLAGHAGTRIVTETSLLAMPETLIGFFPDAGGLHLLSRAPGELGTHCALIGARLGPADALAAGLADHFVSRERVGQAYRAVRAAAGADGDGTGGTAAATEAVAEAVAALADPPPPSAWWQDDREWIDACYAGGDAAVIAARLAEHSSEAARQAGRRLATMSPISVAVTLRALRRAASMTLPEVLTQDLTLAMAFAAHPDFVEGVRAQVVDKDRAPRWRHASVAQVTAPEVDAFFA